MQLSPKANRLGKTPGSWTVAADNTCVLQVASFNKNINFNAKSSSPVSQLMAKGIHLEADSTTQEFKLFHGRGGLYIGRAVLKNNVFVLDFVPDQGTADSDAIVNFAPWTHPPDLNPDFSPGGFCRDNIGNTNNTYNTNRELFDDIATHRQHSTDSCTAANSHSSRGSQKRQLHRRLLLQLRPV
ncbi:unnamed protein product [Closterium sp. NIES-53]